MRSSQFGAVLGSLAVTAGTSAAVLTAGPAQAATPTTVTLSIGGHTQVVGAYGNYVGEFTGSTTYTQLNGDTAEVYDGAADLQRKLPGGSWRVVKTTQDAGFLFYGTYGSHARGNASYRVHYLGGTYTDPNGQPATWDPAYSNVVTVATTWNLHDSGSCTGGCHINGRLGPKAKHHTVVVQVKHGSWKRYKVTRTDRRSRFSASVTATRGKGTLYRVMVTGNKHIDKATSHSYRAVRY